MVHDLIQWHIMVFHIKSLYLKKNFLSKIKFFFFFYFSQTKLQALPHQESLWTRFWPPQWTPPPGVSRFQAWNSPRRFESQKPPSFLQLCVWFQFSRRGSLFPHLALHTWKIFNFVKNCWNFVFYRKKIIGKFYFFTFRLRENWRHSVDIDFHFWWISEPKLQVLLRFPTILQNFMKIKKKIQKLFILAYLQLFAKFRPIMFSVHVVALVLYLLDRLASFKNY